MLNKTMTYLQDLAKHNDKTWFDEHRQDYDDAKTEFTDFLETVIQNLSDIDPSVSHLAAKDCLFRIHRDVRFSPDKTPYKTFFGAEIKAGGRRSEGSGYFIRVKPGNDSGIAAGNHGCSTGTLKRIRDAIAEDATPLRAILNAKAFSKVFSGIQGDTLATAPRGFAKDHPDIDLIRFKQFFVVKKVDDNAVKSNTFVDMVTETFATAMPFNRYLDKVAE